MAVKFISPAQVGTLYNEGEIAAFTPEQEAELIKAGVAKAIEAKKPAAPVQPAKQ